MEWVWPLYRDYVIGRLDRSGVKSAEDAVIEKTFLDLLGASSITILVQEPWRGSVRFKRLEVLQPDRMFELIIDPESYLRETFGGGKFKVNFHHGMHFVATRNFKPTGDARWKDMPELASGHAA